MLSAEVLACFFFVCRSGICQEPEAPGAEAKAPAAQASPASEARDDAPAAAQDPDDRLLKAEILEVSAGDLEKAMATYRSLAGDAAVPERVRARALLCLARSQRKLGEVEAAKKSLEDLLKTYPREREVLRQAQGFLRELQTRKAENPDFDWLSQLERSPEIQTRIFDMAMDLADWKSEAAQRASKQLLALGTIALPVLDKLIETSRDPEHRRRLALFAVRAGRYERLDIILKTGGHVIFFGGEDGSYKDAFAAFIRQVPSLDEAARRSILDTVSMAAIATEAEPYAAALRLVAGDLTGLREKLKTIEGSSELQPIVAAFLLEKHPATGEVLASRIRDGGVGSNAQEVYFEALVAKAPELLSRAEWMALLDGVGEGSQAMGYLRAALRRGALDVVEEVAAAFPRNVLELYPLLQEQQENRVAGSLEEIQAWARILRNVLRDPDSGRPERASRGPARRLVAPRFKSADDVRQGAAARLHQLAEANDGAVPEFLAFLRNRAQEAPEYVGYGSRRTDSGWKPSAPYAEAMAGLLDVRDPVTLAIALEALAQAPARVGPEVAPAVDKLLADLPDARLRDFGIYCLLKRLPSRPETGPAVAGALLADFARFGGAARLPPSAQIPLQKIRTLGAIKDTNTRLNTSNQPTSYGQRVRALGWWVVEVGHEPLMALFPHILAAVEKGAGKDGGRAFLRTLFEVVYRSYSPYYARQILQAEIGRAQTSQVRDALMSLIQIQQEEETASVAAAPGGAEFLKAVVLDPAVPVDTRLRALNLAGEKFLGWFDWPRFLAGDDPLCGELGFREDPSTQWRIMSFAEPLAAYLADLSADEKAAILSAALSSSRENVRTWALSIFPLESGRAVEALKSALADSSPRVRGVAIDRAAKLAVTSPDGRSRLAEVCSAALASPHEDLRVWAVVAIREVPERRELLKKALGDASEQVQDEAIGHLAVLASESAGSAGDLVQLLAHPRGKMNASVHQALQGLAAPETIEPLLKLLEDPSTTVRGMATATLKAIKRTLEERKEWQDLLKELKARKPEGAAP